jgi:hypothetical protein
MKQLMAPSYTKDRIGGSPGKRARARVPYLTWVLGF